MTRAELRAALEKLSDDIDVRDTTLLTSAPPKNAQAWYARERLRTLLANMDRDGGE